MLSHKEEFRRRLVFNLEDHGFTPITLAKALGKNPATVRLWWTGKSQPSIASYYKIKRLLKLKHREFWSEEYRVKNWSKERKLREARMKSRAKCAALRGNHK